MENQNSGQDHCTLKKSKIRIQFFFFINFQNNCKKKKQKIKEICEFLHKISF